MTKPSLYQIALTMINGVGDILCRQLIQYFENPETVFKESTRLLEKVSGIGPTLAREIKNPHVLKRAEKELEFISKNKISCKFLTDEDYPWRLKECIDAPVLFYCKGNMNLNSNHIISIVGTRKATSYGTELTYKLISDLSSILPESLIISGLAYGIDICAHKNALNQNLSTVGVLAHGLDRIYPSIHRETAIKMLENGGLITDFPSGTDPDKCNFVKRNRIVAGLADATVVIESSEKGGSLITADMAFSYGRDVFAFPGRVGDLSSIGCNQLIQQNKAAIIMSGNDLVNAMCWDTNEKETSQIIQTKLFFDEKEVNNKVLKLISEKEDLHINEIALELKKPVHEISVILFELELNGCIKTLPGNRYRLAIK